MSKSDFVLRETKVNINHIFNIVQVLFEPKRKQVLNLYLNQNSKKNISHVYARIEW